MRRVCAHSEEDIEQEDGDPDCDEEHDDPFIANATRLTYDGPRSLGIPRIDGCPKLTTLSGLATSATT